MSKKRKVKSENNEIEFEIIPPDPDAIEIQHRILNQNEQILEMNKRLQDKIMNPLLVSNKEAE